MSRYVRIVLVLFGIALACGDRAQADEPWSFAQITCVPKLGYFSIRKLEIMNLPHMGPFLTEGRVQPDAMSTLQNKHHMFLSEGLRTNPFTCRIPPLEAVPGWEGPREGFEVSIIGHHDAEHNNEQSSYCHMIDDVEIIANGKSLGLMVLNPCDDGSPDLKSVEIAHDGVQPLVRRCTHRSSPDEAVGVEQLICAEEHLTKAK